MSQAFSRVAGKIRDADAVTAELLSEVIREVCSRLPSVRRTKDLQRIEQYIQSGAWTDQPVETSHPDLSLAVLSALVDAQRVGVFPTSTASVPAFAGTEPLYMPFCCDNFA